MTHCRLLRHMRYDKKRRDATNLLATISVAISTRQCKDDHLKCEYWLNLTSCTLFFLTYSLSTLFLGATAEMIMGVTSGVTTVVALNEYLVKNRSPF